MATNEDDGRLLVRLDERTRNFEKGIDGLQQSIEQQTTTLLKALEKHVQDTSDTFDKHDSRLKVLENWRWYTFGAIAVIGVVLSIVLAFLKK